MLRVQLVQHPVFGVLLVVSGRPAWMRFLFWLGRVRLFPLDPTRMCNTGCLLEFILVLGWLPRNGGNDRWYTNNRS